MLSPSFASCAKPSQRSLRVPLAQGLKPGIDDEDSPRHIRERCRSALDGVRNYGGDVRRWWQFMRK